MVDVDAVFWWIFFAEVRRRCGGRGGTGRRRREGQRNLLLAVFVSHRVVVLNVELQSSLIKVLALDKSISYLLLQAIKERLRKLPPLTPGDSPHLIEAILRHHVLRNCDSIVQVDHSVPQSSRHKNRLSWVLNELNHL